MIDEINKKLSYENLPSFLKSRKGWGTLFEMKRLKFPHLHQIEPTNACPYNCIMCPRGKKMKRKVGFMEFSLFTKVIDEVACYPNEIKGKEIELFHFGESLLHPHIAEMYRYVTQKNLNPVISVNATELNREIATKIITSNSGKIIVSLDGFDEESFTRIRGRKIDYNEAVQNIIVAAEIIKQYKSQTKLIVRMISLNENTNKTSDFQHFWGNKGIDAEIRPFFPWGEKEMENLGTYEKHPPYMPCPFPWQYVVVQWNGDVVACCRDLNSENIMGNVNNNTLEEIWNGVNYKQFRNQMIEGIYKNSICKPCMDLYYTEE
jgi:radical SAM protein with 4Fe4S-binding SPASM domain